MKKGRLKIFLGYAAGVGKTYRMLDDAQNLRMQGADIVVGYFEPHGRQDTIRNPKDWNRSLGGRWTIEKRLSRR
jgi:K+-sensing histidine kinase KdpD